MLLALPLPYLFLDAQVYRPPTHSFEESSAQGLPRRNPPNRTGSPARSDGKVSIRSAVDYNESGQQAAAVRKVGLIARILEKTGFAASDPELSSLEQTSIEELFSSDKGELFAGKWTNSAADGDAFVFITPAEYQALQGPAIDLYTSLMAGDVLHGTDDQNRPGLPIGSLSHLPAFERAINLMDIRQGDTITALNGRPVNSSFELWTAAQDSAADYLQISVQRDGKSRTVTIALNNQ